ncbi:MAG: ribonuclease J, partial [Micavibrio aeruginosavorus]
VEKGLVSVFKNCHGRIAITIFASNIARINSIVKAAKASGRSTCIMGRSLHRMTSAAKTNGYLKDIDQFVSEDDLGYIPTDNVVMIVTGSQGEPMAALARMARGEWPKIKLGTGDTVIFSSRAIPGNEKEINDVKNNLTAAKVRIIDPDNASHKIHVSGHPYADEVRDMLSWLKPQYVIPVHGERVMLEAQAEIARSLGAKTVLPTNGAVIKLAPGDVEVVDHVRTGLLAVEPNRIVRSDHKGITERRKLQFSGAIHISLAMNAKFDLIMEPQITLIGLIDHDSAEKQLIGEVRQEVEDAIYDLKNENIFDVKKHEEEIRISVRRMVNQILGIKPKVSVHILKV